MIVSSSDVVIEVESIDRGGNFIGRLTTGDGQSAALMLVQAGLAKVPDSSRNVPNNKQLLDAQEECKRQRIGIWTNYEESKEQEQENEPDNNGNSNPKDYLYFCLFIIHIYFSRHGK